MERSGVHYETILHRDQISPLVQECLPQIRTVFKALDQLAEIADAEDQRLMELANAMADTLRGGLVALFGIDIRPVSEIGPHEDVDLNHALHVLASVVSSGAPEASLRINDPACEALRESVLSLERDLKSVRDRLSNADESNCNDLVERLRKHVGQMRSNKALWPEVARNGRSSGSVTA